MGTRFRWFVAALIFGAGSLFPASVTDLKKLYHPFVEKAATRHGVDADLIHAVIRAESNYDQFAISDKGALGLMQLTPTTAALYGVGNVFDPAQNIDGGTRYLKELINLYGGKTALVLAAYNAGQEAVRKYQGIPPYKETRDYIGRVQAQFAQSQVRVRKPIYKYRDASGRWVLTDDPGYQAKKGR